MSASPAQIRASNKYAKTHYDRLICMVKKEEGAATREHVKAHGGNLNAFIKRAIQEAMERDNAQE